VSRLPHPPDGPAGASAEVCVRLDRALLRIRGLLVRPFTSALPIPSLGRCVDLAKVMACFAIDEAGDAEQGELSVKAVATALQLEHSTASRLLAETEAEGLVERHPDPGDRRRTLVSLTDRGRSVVADTAALRTEAIARVFADWSEEDLATLTGMLERMEATFRAKVPAVAEALAAERAADAPC
jgi:DNA-binding MarR family transcriptional regulator